MTVEQNPSVMNRHEVSGISNNMHQLTLIIRFSIPCHLKTIQHNITPVVCSLRLRISAGLSVWFDSRQWKNLFFDRTDLTFPQDSCKLFHDINKEQKWNRENGSDINLI